MLISEIFYYLWDDLVFNEDMISATPALRSHPEFIDLHRHARLRALQGLYRQLKTLERQLEREKQFHREAQAREVWTINRFLTHVSSEQAEAILIDRKVNNMDPDFSFENANTCLESA
jgi:hypothetical protein